MLLRWGTKTAYGLFNALFRPSKFVQTRATLYSKSSQAILKQTFGLLVVWSINVAIYALPLTITGIGFTSDAPAPQVFETLTEPLIRSPDTGWQFTIAFVQNSVFLTVATGVVFVSFHAGVLISKRSRGVIQSLHTVIYTTSAYLAGIFAVVMYLSTAEGLNQTEELIVTLQVNIFQGVLELMQIGLILPVETDPGPLIFEGITQSGAALLAILLLLTLYFLYSMYLGARLNHNMNRIQSLVVVGGVLASPIAYIAGSAIMTLIVEVYGIQLL